MKAAPKRKKTGGRKARLKAEPVAAEIVKLGGNLTAVAKVFGVARQSLKDFIDKNEHLIAIYNDSREGMLDNAESALYRAVLAGEAWAVCFFLKTQGKVRGYVEKIQTESQVTQTPSMDVDLSKLSREELKTYRDLLKKAAYERAPGSDRSGTRAGQAAG